MDPYLNMIRSKPPTSRFLLKLQDDLDRSIDDIRPYYVFDVSCQGSVPESILAFLESENFEDAVRPAISLGGDSDTMACISGGIAQAYYGRIPETILESVRQRLPESFVHVIDQFNAAFGVSF